ncbi:hypothetical protein TH63_08100 [Rufibacter radiotolerans]|uniref:Uncharacterized protein n=1 Tax=Rufibacter radiotolerans TaxID=1379910 RepID=A0A0H4VPI1_9BACT|nr:hypothetical protein [Rufibacter radiotolerans]AKQ45619.1 hypothetical protein TH63_08100 [Rufibacter radiotolerans]
MLPPEDDYDFKVPDELPIYHKGREIFSLTAQIVALIEEDEESHAPLKELMLEDAAMLTVKVAGAEAADLYDIRMENAAIIRKAARDLLRHSASLEMFGFKEVQYFKLLREAIEEFRLLFIEWVQSFDPWNYVVDQWGLFNPPGINPSPEEQED